MFEKILLGLGYIKRERELDWASQMMGVDVEMFDVADIIVFKTTRTDMQATARWIAKVANRPVVILHGEMDSIEGLDKEAMQKLIDSAHSYGIDLKIPKLRCVIKNESGEIVAEKGKWNRLPMDNEPLTVTYV